MRIAFQGTSGAYSEAAALRAWPGAEVAPFDRFEQVFDAVAQGRTSHGILPVENSIGGSIHINYDLLLQHDLPIVAEDLGTITPDVHALRDEFDFPGMRVLQFAFGGDPHDTHLPHEYVRNTVAYTGTHDNDTVVGWFQQRSREDASEGEKRERELCLKYLGTDGAEINWDFIRAAQMSVAALAVAQLQDVLGLGSDARMNTPASTEGNWDWRYAAGSLTDELAARLREMTVMYGRLDG